MTYDDNAAEFLESLSQEKTCQWCQYPYKRIYRAGLCRPCYDIRCALNRIRARVKDFESSGGGHPKVDPIELDRQYRVEVEMEKDAKIEGNRYGGVAGRNVTGLDLEEEMSSLSRSFLGKKDLYFGRANLFDQSFSPNQRKVLYYLLSVMQRHYLRRTRRPRAQYV
jgi:hypothetical protein